MLESRGGTSIAPEAIQRLLASKKFLVWTPEIIHRKSGNGKVFEYKGPSYKNLVVDEKHFSPTELAQAWGVSAETVRSIFRSEPGVLRLPSRQASRDKRGYVTIKIPQSVAERVHRRLSAVPQ